MINPASQIKDRDVADEIDDILDNSEDGNLSELLGELHELARPIGNTSPRFTFRLTNKKSEWFTFPVITVCWLPADLSVELRPHQAGALLAALKITNQVVPVPHTGWPDIDVLGHLIEIEPNQTFQKLTDYFPLHRVALRVEHLTLSSNAHGAFLTVSPEAHDCFAGKDGTLSFSPLAPDRSTLVLARQLTRRVGEVRNLRCLVGRRLRFMGFRDPRGFLHPFAVGHLKKEIWLEPETLRRALLEYLLAVFYLDLNPPVPPVQKSVSLVQLIPPNTPREKFEDFPSMGNHS